MKYISSKWHGFKNSILSFEREYDGPQLIRVSYYLDKRGRSISRDFSQHQDGMWYVIFDDDASMENGVYIPFRGKKSILTILKEAIVV